MHAKDLILIRGDLTLAIRTSGKKAEGLCGIRLAEDFGD